MIVLPGGQTRRIELPEGKSVSVPTWAPDGRRFAFTVDEADGISVWIADAQAATAAEVPGLRVRDVLGGDPTSPGSTVRWSRDGQSLIALGSPAPPGRPARSRSSPRWRRPREAIRRWPPSPTCSGPTTHGDLFEGLATTLPLRVDPDSGVATELGPAGLCYHLSDSPDGEHLLVYRLQRPFSFRVPFPSSPAGSRSGRAAGDLERVIADLPVSDEIPRHGVPVGPRMVSWEESVPASLVWTEAQDGGDPLAKAEHRDLISRLPAPFNASPQPSMPVQHRCLGWYDMAAAGSLLVTEHDRDRRWLTSRLVDLAAPDGSRVIFDHSADEAYHDPGSPMMTTHPDGTRTVCRTGIRSTSAARERARTATAVPGPPGPG